MHSNRRSRYATCFDGRRVTKSFVSTYRDGIHGIRVNDGEQHHNEKKTSHVFLLVVVVIVGVILGTSINNNGKKREEPKGTPGPAPVPAPTFESLAPNSWFVEKRGLPSPMDFLNQTNTSSIGQCQSFCFQYNQTTKNITIALIDIDESRRAVKDCRCYGDVSCIMQHDGESGLVITTRVAPLC
eukprot:CAMPEP_0116866456 /NCGR_PEP_ID=MMETSP0418-20121206/26031_1 /TAXON_ID=1158023 /ORGANISM="Astrosyne radiata, Strain 13vi08-1A" /LENGTH=183 /DNA_ID=CAMNT_0004502077 /DNA_START=56 /DNA_END=607 /DNA_ORIENTATION=-